MVGLGVPGSRCYFSEEKDDINARSDKIIFNLLHHLSNEKKRAAGRLGYIGDDISYPVTSRL